MSPLKHVLILVLTAGLLAGCTNTMGTKQTAGTVGGAVLGGLAGSQFGGGTGKLIMTGAGTLLGAYLGSEIGSSLDRADQAAAQQAYNRAYTAPVGQTISWNNPSTGHYGNVTPIRDGRSASGNYCREFQQDIVVGGRSERAYGTACQEPDGSWKIVN